MGKTEVLSSNKLISIQILRCVAAIMVALRHSGLATRLFERNYSLGSDLVFRTEHWTILTNHLYAGVDIFFCISGFVMTMLAERASAKDCRAFITDRFVRIMPPYWFFTLVIIALTLLTPRFFVGLTGDWKEIAQRIVTSLLLIPQAKEPVYGIGWSLVHEFIFYCFIALLILLRQNQRIVLILGIATCTGLVMSWCGIKVLYGYFLSTFYVEFFLGALAYRLYQKTSRFYPEGQVIMAVLFYMLVSSLLDAIQAPLYHSFIRGFGFGTMGFLLISGSMGVDSKYKLEMYCLPRLLGRIGDASYSLYLSHWFVLFFCGRLALFISGAQVFLVLLWHISSILIAVCFAVIFAENAELPFHRKVVRYLKSRRALTREAKLAEFKVP